jgi:hypothetical protein
LSFSKTNKHSVIGLTWNFVVFICRTYLYELFTLYLSFSFILCKQEKITLYKASINVCVFKENESYDNIYSAHIIYTHHERTLSFFHIPIRVTRFHVFFIVATMKNASKRKTLIGMWKKLYNVTPVIIILYLFNFIWPCATNT